MKNKKMLGSILSLGLCCNLLSLNTYAMDDKPLPSENKVSSGSSSSEEAEKEKFFETMSLMLKNAKSCSSPFNERIFDYMVALLFTDVCNRLELCYEANVPKMSYTFQYTKDKGFYEQTGYVNLNKAGYNSQKYAANFLYHILDTALELMKKDYILMLPSVKSCLPRYKTTPIFLDKAARSEIDKWKSQDQYKELLMNKVKNPYLANLANKIFTWFVLNRIPLIRKSG